MTYDPFSIEGKVALITGGTRGIGLWTAEGLLRAGATVIVSSRKAETCSEAAAQLSKFGNVMSIPADVSDPNEALMLMDSVAKSTSRLDILVNNAGTTWGAPFDTMPPAAWNRVLALNVTAPFVLTQAARHLLEAATIPDDPARVINIGSIDGLTVSRLSNFPYGASKAAIHHLTRHLAAELSPSILVNAIAPGPFPTKMLASVSTGTGEEELAKDIPLRRLGKGSDIAALAVFLCSRASSYITGAVIPLDGGLSTTAKSGWRG